MSYPPAMLRRMDRVGVRMVRRMIPRRWKRIAGIAVLVGMLVRPDLAMQAASWVWTERAQRAVSTMTDTFLPGTSPVELPAPPVPERGSGLPGF